MRLAVKAARVDEGASPRAEGLGQLSAPPGRWQCGHQSTSAKLLALFYFLALLPWGGRCPLWAPALLVVGLLRPVGQDTARLAAEEPGQSRP